MNSVFLADSYIFLTANGATFSISFHMRASSLMQSFISFLSFGMCFPFHADDRFDVPHDLFQHCFTIRGHVFGYQIQFLGVEELLHVVHSI